MYTPEPGLQPFQCPICNRRFTRRENLKRHAALHSEVRQSIALPCEHCDGTFSRQDLRLRHIQRKHPGCIEKGSLRRKSTSPYNSSLRTPNSAQHEADQMDVTIEHDFDYDDRVIDTDVSVAGETQSALSLSPPASDPARSLAVDVPQCRAQGFNYTQMTATSYSTTASASSYGHNHSNSIYTSVAKETTFPSRSQMATGIQLFFKNVSSFLPFLHQSSAKVSHCPRYLVLGMLALGYQYGEDPSCGHAPRSGNELSRQCFDEARKLVVAVSSDETIDSEDLEIVQTYLLLEVCALLYFCGSTSALGLEWHSRLIARARARGLMCPALDHTTFEVDGEDLDDMWQAFIRAESQKRTLHAILQIDALWYQLLSVPRSISHLEIKHDLPCCDRAWNATSASKWAFHRLRTGDTTRSLGYADAVRRFISPAAQISGVKPPMLDSYGAISVAQFLLSSIREVSGWSSLTGLVSLDRFEPLKASVIALEPSIRLRGDDSRQSGLLCEATWEMAMIELHLWSRLHTVGIVESSLDNVLYQSTSHARAGEAFVLDAELAQSCQPHIDWFIRYLDASSGGLLPSEPPWVAIYAYKAFLIAWELVRRGDPLSDVMESVGIQQRDVDGCLRWAKTVFGRRRDKRLGELMYQFLDILAS